MDGDRDRVSHNQRQAEAFNHLANSFLQRIPDDIQARTVRIVDEAHLERGARVLDVGTGTGVLLPLLLRTQPSRLVACDLSEEMLRRAEETFGGQVEFVHADVVDLPKELGDFDAVFCNACFANFFDPEQTLRAIATRLSPSGIVVVSHPMGFQFVEHLRMSSPELELKALPAPATAAKVLNRSGLTLETMIDEPLLYILIGRRLG